MNIVFIIIGIVILSIIAFIISRNIAFKKSSAKTHKLRFERIEPLYKKLENGESISKEEILKFAKDNKTREMTYQLLLEHKKVDLFPNEYLTIIGGAESNLVNWLEFPTELDKAPDHIEHIKQVTIKLDENDVLYHVFKYKTEKPHWAAENGWMLGVVGPYFEDSKPYDFPHATFSRCSSKVGEITAEDEAKWVHKNIALKK